MLTVQYGEPEYQMENETDLRVTIAVTLKDELGVAAGEFTASRMVNKNNPDAATILANLLTQDINGQVAEVEELLVIKRVIGPVLMAALLDGEG